MSKLKVLAGLAFLVVMCNLGWQVGKWELTSVELHDDMKDMASQLGPRNGYGKAKSDDEFRDDILRKAKDYDIPLSAEQITVQRVGEGFKAYMYFAADYTVPIQVAGYSFQMHFTPESGPKPN